MIAVISLSYKPLAVELECNAAVPLSQLVRASRIMLVYMEAELLLGCVFREIAH